MKIVPAKMPEKDFLHFKQAAEIGGSGSWSPSLVRALIGHILALEAEVVSRVTIVFSERNDEQRVIQGVFSNEHEALKCCVQECRDGATMTSRQYEIQDKYIPEE